MSFEFHNLNNEMRAMMAEEIKFDVDKQSLYLSQRLNEDGLSNYSSLLQKAVQTGDEVSLTRDLKPYLNETEQRRTPSGGYTTAKVPVNAAEMLAEGEFNRFYIRALCRFAIDKGNRAVRVYRAKQVMNARSESASKIGTLVDAQKLLNDLRENIGVDTALGLPSGPNSGLSVEIV